MGARRLGRERALQALYQLEMGGTSPKDAVEAAWAAGHEEPDVPLDPSEQGQPTDARQFTQALVEGAWQHRSEIDALIQEHSHNWRLDRMSRIDRNVLRIAIFEMKYRDDIPRKVSINEAVELGKRFGTEESSAFINGLLDRVAIALGKR